MEKITYTVTPIDVEESLLCLDWKREGRRKLIHLSILMTIEIGCLWYIYYNSANLVAYFIASLILVTWFFLIYYPSIRRRVKSKHILKKGDKYAIEFPMTEIERVFESENVITIQNSKDFFCIPKSALKATQLETLREEILQKAKEKITVNL